jgi:hypothetical protein
MEQLNLLNALNDYAHQMKVGETDSPITFRMVNGDDVLVSDSLILDGTIQQSHFESGNYFALAQDGAFVYCKEQVAKNLNCLFFVVSDADLDKAIAYHYEMNGRLKTEINHFKSIRKRTETIIVELETINKP